MNRVAVAVFACLGLAACNKAPQTPSPTVTTLAVSPATDLIRIKATEKFSVTATYSSGTVEAVTPSWASDNSTVASVDAAGTVTGVSSGQANITASFQGKTASRTLRVVPDYTGTWAGTWTVTSCQVQGNFRSDWCGPLQGNSFPATLTIDAQSRDVVSGRWTLQDSNGTVQGTIATNGTLALTGSSLQSGVRIDISSWQTTSTDNRAMTGTFTLTWTIPDKPGGSGVTQISLSNFNKQ